MYKLETSDHDGYCSGDECTYSIQHLSHTINTKDPTLYYLAEPSKFSKFVPNPIMKYWSYYCDVDDESQQNGLDKHDYRITITHIDRTVLYIYYRDKYRYSH